ncbi:subclass B1 metallo-beta-lactamase [Galbibacter pacificus]|uniref:beta-lactamase n=1 Tax=Galbibacter pacificus TaxID=2996052 RepID=A0ABT6FU64_9FLAO|nr:subclass B1 metallo-beta-lactamase [Galbibacter pacificus]MDG3583321.1 subclass B1 metallo-beta-lactamase [Galbibacter pacificus]MDG3586802.1 subclass B1 metallo-beta-lactamase [Galbibacter pacificus]
MKYILVHYLFIGLCLLSCKNSLKSVDTAVYESDNLIVNKISNQTYEHISYLNTKEFGRVPSNGMFVVNEGEVVIFDTPVNNESSLELIEFITKNLKSNITAVIPTHFHEDCVGGLKAFADYGISIYASNKTLELLKEKRNKLYESINGFNDTLVLNLGKEEIYTKYFGEGHTIDNVIGYFPKDNVVFGGCLIKEIGANKGNLEDANTNDWSKTVEKIKTRYPDVKIVIPGHGNRGGAELFDYTMKLFK